MPNHIINTIRLTGDREKISELLESVKDNRFGIDSLDFNKVIPMPESLQIETSSSRRPLNELKSEDAWNEYSKQTQIKTFEPRGTCIPCRDFPKLSEYD